MEKAYVQRFNIMHMIHKTLGTCEHDYTEMFDIHFTTLPEVVAFDTYFVDPQYELAPYWDADLIDKDKMEYKDTCNKRNDQIESEDLITNAHVSNALW